MKIDQELAHKLAELIHLARNKHRYGTWDIAGTTKFILEAANRGDAFDVAHAALRAAADPGNRTPAIIAKDGRHWRPAAPAPSRPAIDPFCRRCRQVHPDTEPCEQLQPVTPDAPTPGAAQYRHSRETLKAEETDHG